MLTRTFSWKISRTTSSLRERTSDHGDWTYIEGDVLTPYGMASVEAGRSRTSGARYLSMRTVERGRCYVFYTERFPTFSRLALVRRAGLFIRTGE